MHPQRNLSADPPLECTIVLARPPNTTLGGPLPTSPQAQGTEDPLRTAIFSTLTKIANFIIKILVDSGSVVNAVAAASIPALELRPELHPTPYKAMWINEATLSVTHRCLVPLRVAGYGGEVWCNVLPMGVGRVLLGRPWLYDFHVAQYGRANRCVFFFGGNKHIWQPYIPLNQSDESSATESTARRLTPPLLGLVTARQFIKGLESDAPMWAVQVRTKVAETTVEGYPAFLQKFANVFPAKLTESVPPDRMMENYFET